MNIYVGNLSHEINEEDLRNAFSVFGEVVSTKIIKDRYDGRSKGFGFVEMPDRLEANKAIERPTLRRAEDPLEVCDCLLRLCEIERYQRE